MKLTLKTGRARLLGYLSIGLTALVLSACGGGSTSDNAAAPRPISPNIVDASGTATSVMLRAVPANAEGSGGTPDPTVTVHYQRTTPSADDVSWILHTWGAAQGADWGTTRVRTGTDSFGNYYVVPLDPARTTNDMGYLVHKGTDDAGKELFGGTKADQSFTLGAGKNEFWRIQGDPTVYDKNPMLAANPDLTSVKVHYLRFAGDYANWGLHYWDGSNIDMAALTAAGSPTSMGWDSAVGFDHMPNYTVGTSEISFTFPVVNPKGTNRTGFEFIVHGKAPNQNDKDGWGSNIFASYSLMNITNQVGEVWLIEGTPTVYYKPQDLRSSSLTNAAAVWLNGSLIQWPRVFSVGGNVKLYYSQEGQIKARKDEKVSGADGYLALDNFTGTVPATVAERFKYVKAGGVFNVKAADVSRMKDLHKMQLVAVQENASGFVQNAASIQVAGALDDLYGAASSVSGFGVTVAGGNTTFKLWAPTAANVSLFTYDTPAGNATAMDAMAFDATTGVWSLSKASDLSGKYYRYGVDVFVRGNGFVRNFVTDPNSIGLTANSTRSYIADLNAAALKPAGWDADTPPTTVASTVDMSIYELHVRDFSANDATVTAANRGKYLAFTEKSANGWKHLKALADAGLTDVHLLPTFDIASVKEVGCVSPTIPDNLASDDIIQRATIDVIKSDDCFNWGYDPYHYTVPEGSYASDAVDASKRIVEFRAMVKGLHEAGLRVGMDVVYNHTTSSGQAGNSVLDRVVPGYYYRLSALGQVTGDTCCQDTAAENMMMAKLMEDSLSTWARDYKVSSFRFDLMGFHPRAVMQSLKTKVAAAAGRPVQMFGEGWNFGNVQNGARFEQATFGNLKGDGIGTFANIGRDTLRGGGPFDGGNDFVKNQGYINGLGYDANALSPAPDYGNIRWKTDLIKGGLAGSIVDYVLPVSWDQTRRLDSTDLKPFGDSPAVGYATQPDEVVNYVENHDNHTLFDTNVLKLPLGTSKADRARVQLLGAAFVGLSQGIPYFHAGVDTLRSKSLDNNSYDSGDWFNRLDWSYTDNNYGVGKAFNYQDVFGPFLAPATAAAIKPTPADIAWTRDAFRDLLKIRKSTTLLRLRTADDIKTRLTFYNTGSSMVNTVIMARVNGTGYAGAGFSELVYVINVDKVTQSVTADALKSKSFVLHPVQANGSDSVVKGATYDNATGRFTVPARTAAVFVVNP